MEKKLTLTQSKAHQRQDGQDRAMEYKLWHRQLERGLYMHDVDSIEWRYREGELVPVAVIEITRTDSERPLGPKYLEAIIERFEKRDFQAKVTRLVAEALKVDAYIALYKTDCSKFFVYNLTKGGPWNELDELGMKKFLKSL